MSKISYTIVDAFTTKPFCGNPAAIVILPPTHGLPYTTLQSIATEFNLSDTAFLTQTDLDKLDTYDLRWFTPGVEVKMCGHATIASASYLFKSGIVPENVEVIKFNTKWSGVWTAKRVVGTEMVEIELPAGELLPLNEARGEKVKSAVLKALGESDLNVTVLGQGEGIYEGYFLINIEDESFDLKNAKIDVSHFNDPSFGPFALFILTTTNVPEHKAYNVRVFAPLAGVNEDPVCGSANCFIAPYWSQRLDRKEVSATHVSLRGGEFVTVWDRESGRVKLRGDARLAAEGTMYL